MYKTRSTPGRQVGRHRSATPTSRVRFSPWSLARWQRFSLFSNPMQRWCNGSTGVSKAFSLGSNPSLCVPLRVPIRTAYILAVLALKAMGSIPKTLLKLTCNGYPLLMAPTPPTKYVSRSARLRVWATVCKTAAFMHCWFKSSPAYGFVFRCITYHHIRRGG